MKHSEARAPEIADYLLEEYLRCPNKYYNKHILQQSRDHLNWKQLVQYAVNHTVHQTYSIPAESRTPANVSAVFDRYWTNKVNRFESAHHYHRVKSTVTRHLIDELLSDSASVPPALLFESIRVRLDELQVDISMIFQAVYWTRESFAIQKFLVDEDRDVMNAFVHMAGVISRHAFQALPERIEIITLMTGNKYVYRPRDEELPASLDYLRLMSRLFRELTVYKRSDPVCECTGCPFTSRCRNESDRPTATLNVLN